MKRCDQNMQSFPDVEPADTIECLTGPFKGNVYIVSQPESKLMLINLNTGKIWSNESFWGYSSPKDWRKVECCYTVTS